MIKDNLSSLIIVGGIALIFLTFTGSQHANWWSNTKTVAQVVEEFNSTKHIKARSWEVPAETMPKISVEEVLASLDRQYAAFNTSSEQRQTLEAAFLTQRLPECTYIRLSDTDVFDSLAGVQLEIRIERSETDDLYVGDGNFTVPLKL